MALEVEGVVDGGVHAEKPLGGTSRLRDAPAGFSLGIPESLASAMDALPKVRFASDSPLEESGFELVVPLMDAGLFGRTGRK